MALAWKAGWVNSPRGFESRILRHLTSGNTGPAPSVGPEVRSLVSVVVSIGLRAAVVGTHEIGPEQVSNTTGNVAPDRVCHMLITSGHRRRRPAHDSHHRPLRDVQHQEYRRGRMSSVVQPAIPYSGPSKKRLPIVVVRVRVQRSSRG